MKKRKPTCHASPSGRHSKAKDMTHGYRIPWCEWCSAQIIRRGQRIPSPQREPKP